MFVKDADIEVKTVMIDDKDNISRFRDRSDQSFLHTSHGSSPFNRNSKFPFRKPKIPGWCEDISWITFQNSIIS